MKTVLVTGADGFIGSHLVEMLVEKGIKVRALSCYNSFNYWGWLEDVECIDKIEIITGDIRDRDLCNDLTKGIDTIFHLAALIAIPYSYKAPRSYVETNVTGTLNLCQAALENNCSRFIHTSTSEVYGTARYVPIDEKHPLQPQSPYSASKIAADSMALSFYYSFGLPLTVARPFNTYGPRQSARAVIPTIITQIAYGKKEINFGDVKPTRDFNYVRDTCKGLIMISEAEQTNGEVFNIGSNTEVSIGEIFQIIAEIMGSDSRLVIKEERLRPASSEIYRLVCDNSKLRNLTGYKQDYDLRQGITETINWFKRPEYLKKYKSGIYNV
jgi:NAD dependent epimerase/dehydratase